MQAIRHTITPHHQPALEFPYQVVTFLGEEPAIGEPVYYGEHGWYPQLAIKRRFKLQDCEEDVFVENLKEFFGAVGAVAIVTGELIAPERMPVRVIATHNQDELKGLHTSLLEAFGPHIVSRYPDREGDSYYPHITAEYNGAIVVPVAEYTNRTFTLNNVWLLKDIEDENSVAYAKIR